ncbi:DUF2062 domain-containing protein [Paenibacillus chartarius]|uniref:DUF2062 domain-containing protein n=1 Tax=Paenibacillus chartarius TaxID=747481 RepID=A0ABV6DKA2_9BACL
MVKTNRNAAAAYGKFDRRKAGRWFRYQYVRLLRAKGGPHRVALGFGIGLAIEMFTLPTGGLAALLILPLVALLRANLAAAFIGFLFGKIIYVPMAFLNVRVGSLVLPKQAEHYFLHHLPHWAARVMEKSLALIVGGMIDGVLLALAAYIPLRMLLTYTANRRKEKRRVRLMQG